MDLQGTIDNYESFINILQFIMNSSSAKKLILRRSCGEGEVNYTLTFKGYFLCKIETNDPAVMEIENLESKFKAIFHTLMLFEHRCMKFKVEDTKIAEIDKNCVDVKNCIMDFLKTIDEVYPTLKEKHITLDSVFTLNPEFNASKAISLSPLAFKLLAAFADRKPIKEFIWKCGEPEKVLKEMKNLVDIGFLKLENEEKDVGNFTVSKEVMEKFESELKKIVGPIADVLIDGAKEELGIEGTPTRKQLVTMIETISDLAGDYKDKILALKRRFE
ncbi:hypothetical protein [Desulfurobacterium indicum]|uniref:DUF4388 domain-containing protein n=1 Tax=Desulfurobacterium indicum TaxID=1914305 RepID=A0A1R1MJ91_9BACT|nr:hypothetical protein [Desulfurobacterium indicum]OMH39867.1 hypothetical protein BLW93_08265 [Desulfurobacterium indicum]